jgi:hypothetical protein
MSCLPRGAHDLTDEALWTFGAPISVPDAPWPDIDLVIPHGHGDRCPQNDGRWRSTH